MRRVLIYLSNSHEVILKFLVVALAVGLITTLLPHKVRYKFEIQKGKIWQNEDLVAPFDFAIYKHPDSLKSEKNRVLSTIPPYFVVDTVVFGEILQTFEDRVDKAEITDEGKFRFLEAGETILTEIYSRGVIRISDTEPAGENGGLSLVRGKFVYSRVADDFFSQTSAVEILRQQSQLLLADEAAEFQNLLSDLITPNIFFDRRMTDQFRQQAERDVLPTRGMVTKGELIIARGQLVTDEKYLLLESLKKATGLLESDKTTTREIFAGQLMIVAVALTVLLLFLALLRKDIFANNRKVTLILTVMVLMIAAYTGAMKMPQISLYVVPFCILPVVIRVFFDTRLALFTHVVTILILGSIAPNGFEFVFMQIIAGMVAIFSITNLRKRSNLFSAAGLIFLSYAVTYTALAIIHEGSIAAIDFTPMTWLLGNVLLTLFSYPLIFIFEKVFGLTSDISLMELSDSNAPLLRELSVKAPGTFQHSMQVANLAEAAAYSIGGNTLLVRVGALYHDIGKMEMPLYFIENQSTGVNPHDELTFEESASIIISHVIKGIEIARKHKLPDLVIDFIRTHHGTSMVQYFYQSFLKNYPEKLVDEDDFRYPGPLPFSKETAVLMMADSVEAASRSLTRPDAEAISNLVDSIIDNQIEQQQYINSDITFRDISTIKKIFKKMLKSIYHVRVEYPRR